ncbi:MAG: chemotaxis protein CheB, partial [Syntrophales bacterium]
MNTKSKKRPAAKKSAASIDIRKGGNDAASIVVGVGASAGGTKSLKRFFAKMPAGRGVAFVLVQYSERKRGNLTVKLFKDRTELAVVEAKDGMTVLAGHIYIIPPDKFLSISGGKLTLQEPVLCNGLRMPIDHFFCSLALDQRHRSIGVLLSGKGSDGILGLSEIKAAGGRTFVEDPASATYPGMPQSAIDAGVAGGIMPAETMAEAVTEMAGRLMADPRAPAGQPEPDADLRSVLDILQAKVGHDFRCYKPGTIIR